MIDTSNAPLCKCGCGLRVSRFITKTQKWNIYYKGHVKNEAKKEPPLCACGCGKYVTWNKKACKWNLHIKGHKSISLNYKLAHENESPLCACGCMQAVSWNNSRHKWAKYKRGHGMKKNLTNPPLCRCGCGKRVTANKGCRKWNEYLYGHISIERKIIMSNSLKGKKVSLETRNKLSVITAIRWANPEYKERVSNAIRKAYEDNPVLRKKQGLITKKRYEDNPELRILSSRKMANPRI
jgi:hypothetical protein